MDSNRVVIELRRRSRPEAERLVSEFEQSGLGRKELCAARGLTIVRSWQFDPTLLRHVSPLGWEHINLIGDYTWHANKRVAKGGFREASADFVVKDNELSKILQPYIRNDNEVPNFEILLQATNFNGDASQSRVLAVRIHSVSPGSL